MDGSIRSSPRGGDALTDNDRGLMRTQEFNDSPAELDAVTDARPEAAPLRPVELMVIAAVWVFFGGMAVATVLVDRRGGTGGAKMSRLIDSSTLSSPPLIDART